MERLTNRVYDILAERESDGMFQSELWKKLKLSSRDGSRLALKLERMGTITREKILEKGEFGVTGELGPPKHCGTEKLKENIGHLKNVVDAANITDNQTAIVRISSLATASICIQESLEPIIPCLLNCCCTSDLSRIFSFSRASACCFISP